MNCTIANEGEKVVLVLNGKRVCDMPPEIARQLSRVLYQKAVQCEEYMQANRIIMDQAILQRSGSPVGLSNNPAIQAEAKKEAQWNSTLRRAMPLKGIEPRSVVGTPAVLRSPPEKRA